MTRLKSRRLRRGRKVRQSELARAGTKLILASADRAPQPLMDWGELNEAKLLYCHRCLSFDTTLGGCKFKLLPSKECPKFKDDGSNSFKKSGIRPLPRKGE